VISRKSNIYELTEFEHAYAPPYSSAKDPVNMAGFVAENILSKKLNLFYWDEVSHLENDKVIIDVRSPEEFAKGAIPNAINIPVDEIRSRMGEIPKDKAIRIYCQAGLRGYLAQRILMQNGINDILNLSGGYQLWNACVN
jgi:rhodanese-related sulfurtransferase